MEVVLDSKLPVFVELESKVRVKDRRNNVENSYQNGTTHLTLLEFLNLFIILHQQLAKEVVGATSVFNILTHHAIWVLSFAEGEHQSY